MKNNFFKKWVSAVLICAQLVSLTFSDARASEKRHAISGASVISADAVRVAADLGRVQTRIDGKLPKTLLVIEDAHAVPAAQKSIWKLIENLRGQYGSFPLLLEGITEAPDLALEHSFPDRDWLLSQIESDVRAQNISGAAAALILSRQLIAHSAESKDLYIQAVRLYQDAQRQKTAVLNKLARAKDIVTKSKEKVYPREALKWNRLIEQDSLDGLKVVLESGQKESFENYKHLQSTRELVRRQQFLKRPAVVQFWGQFLAKLEQRAGLVSQKKPLAALKEEFRLNHLSLPDSAEKLEALLSADEVSKMTKLEQQLYRLALKSAREWREINAAKLAEEYRIFLIKKTESFFTKSAQRMLLNQTLRILLLEKLVRLELSHADWKIVQKMNLENPAWAVFKDFYSIQHDRERMMAKQIEKSFQTSSSAVFVSGGFHRAGLEKIARDQGWGFVVITPAMKTLEGSERYADLMRGQVGWRSEMKNERGNIDLQKAYWSYLLKQYAKEKPDQVYDLLLQWRKQLILRMADLKMLNHAVETAAPIHAWLADFMPENSKQKFRTEWLNRLKENHLSTGASALSSAMTQSPFHLPFGIIPADLIQSAEILAADSMVKKARSEMRMDDFTLKGRDAKGIEQKKIDESLDVIRGLTDDVTVTWGIPAYNEIERLHRPSGRYPAGEDAFHVKLQQLQMLREVNPQFHWRMVFVDDGSPDLGTFKLLKQLRRSSKLDPRQVQILRMRPDEKRGPKGGAVHLGLNAALQSVRPRGKHYIGYTDMDISTNLLLTGLLIKPMAETTLNGAAIGVRRGKGSYTEGRNWQALISSLLYNWAIRLLLPPIANIRDTQAGFKIFSPETLRAILPVARDFSFSFDSELLLLAALNKKQIAQVPIAWFDSVAASTFAAQSVNRGFEALKTVVDVHVPHIKAAQRSEARATRMSKEDLLKKIGEDTPERWRELFHEAGSIVGMAGLLSFSAGAIQRNLRRMGLEGLKKYHHPFEYFLQPPRFRSLYVKGGGIPEKILQVIHSKLYETEKPKLTLEYLKLKIAENGFDQNASLRAEVEDRLKIKKAFIRNGADIKRTAQELFDTDTDQAAGDTVGKSKWRPFALESRMQRYGLWDDPEFMEEIHEIHRKKTESQRPSFAAALPRVETVSPDVRILSAWKGSTEVPDWLFAYLAKPQGERFPIELVLHDNFMVPLALPRQFDANGKVGSPRFVFDGYQVSLSEVDWEQTPVPDELVREEMNRDWVVSWRKSAVESIPTIVERDLVERLKRLDEQRAMGLDKQPKILTRDHIINRLWHRRANHLSNEATALQNSATPGEKNKSLYNRVIEWNRKYPERWISLPSMRDGVDRAIEGDYDKSNAEFEGLNRTRFRGLASILTEAVQQGKDLAQEPVLLDFAREIAKAMPYYVKQELGMKSARESWPLEVLSFMKSSVEALTSAGEGASLEHVFFKKMHQEFAPRFKKLKASQNMISLNEAIPDSKTERGELVAAAAPQESEINWQMLINQFYGVLTKRKIRHVSLIRKQEIARQVSRVLKANSFTVPALVYLSGDWSAMGFLPSEDQPLEVTVFVAGSAAAVKRGVETVLEKSFPGIKANIVDFSKSAEEIQYSDWILFHEEIPLIFAGVTVEGTDLQMRRVFNRNSDFITSELIQAEAEAQMEKISRQILKIPAGRSESRDSSKGMFPKTLYGWETRQVLPVVNALSLERWRDDVVDRLRARLKAPADQGVSYLTDKEIFPEADEAIEFSFYEEAVVTPQNSEIIPRAEFLNEGDVVLVAYDHNQLPGHWHADYTHLGESGNPFYRQGRHPIIYRVGVVQKEWVWDDKKKSWRVAKPGEKQGRAYSFYGDQDKPWMPVLTQESPMRVYRLLAAKDAADLKSLAAKRSEMRQPHKASNNGKPKKIEHAAQRGPLESRIRLLLKEVWSIFKTHQEWQKAVVAFGSARIPEGHRYYAAAEQLGAYLVEKNLAGRTGAGPSIMEAVLKGMMNAMVELLARLNQSAVGTQITLGVQQSAQRQGIRITLPFEKETNGFVEVVKDYIHFITRKKALYENSYGAIAFPGGYGTMDEVFEVLTRGVPLVLYGRDFWGPIVEAFTKSLKEENLSDVFQAVHVTDDVEDAVQFLLKNQTRMRKGGMTREHVIRSNREIAREMRRLRKMPRAVTLAGEPQVLSSTLPVGFSLSAYLQSLGVSVRVANRELLDHLMDGELARKSQPHLAAVLLNKTDPQKDSTEQRIPKSRMITLAEQSNHQFLVTGNSYAYVFFPGGANTFNILFDTLQILQIEYQLQKQPKVKRKPIILVGKRFWQPIKDALTQQMLDGSLGVNTISREDPSLLIVVDSVQEAVEEIQKFLPHEKQTQIENDLNRTALLSVSARSEARQSLLNHPSIGKMIRREILGGGRYFMDVYELRLKKPEHSKLGSKEWLYDDDKIALAVNDYAKQILRDNYSPLSRFEIKQFRKAVRSQNADYYKANEVPFYLERREHYGLPNDPKSLKAQNPGLYRAVLRDGYKWENLKWSRSEMRGEEVRPTWSRYGQALEGRVKTAIYFLKNSQIYEYWKSRIGLFVKHYSRVGDETKRKMAGREMVEAFQRAHALTLKNMNSSGQAQKENQTSVTLAFYIGKTAVEILSAARVDPEGNEYHHGALFEQLAIDLDKDDLLMPMIMGTFKGGAPQSTEGILDILLIDNHFTDRRIELLGLLLSEGGIPLSKPVKLIVGNRIDPDIKTLKDFLPKRSEIRIWQFADLGLSQTPGKMDVAVLSETLNRFHARFDDLVLIPRNVELMIPDRFFLGSGNERDFIFWAVTKNHEGKLRSGQERVRVAYTGDQFQLATNGSKPQFKMDASSEPVYLKGYGPNEIALEEENDGERLVRFGYVPNSRANYLSVASVDSGQGISVRVSELRGVDRSIYRRSEAREAEAIDQDSDKQVLKNRFYSQMTMGAVIWAVFEIASWYFGFPFLFSLYSWINTFYWGDFALGSLITSGLIASAAGAIADYYTQLISDYPAYRYHVKKRFAAFMGVRFLTGVVAFTANIYWIDLFTSPLLRAAVSGFVGVSFSILVSVYFNGYWNRRGIAEMQSRGEKPQDIKPRSPVIAERLSARRSEHRMLPGASRDIPVNFDLEIIFAVDYQLLHSSRADWGQGAEARQRRQAGHALFQKVSGIQNLFENRSYLGFIEAILMSPDFFGDSNLDSHPSGGNYRDFYATQILRALNQAENLLQHAESDPVQVKNAVAFLEMLDQDHALEFVEFSTRAQNLLREWPEWHLIVSEPNHTLVARRLKSFFDKVAHENSEKKEKRLRDILLSSLIHPETAGILRSLLWEELLASMQNGKGVVATDFFRLLARLLFPMETPAQINSVNNLITTPNIIIEGFTPDDLKDVFERFLRELQGEDQYALGYAAIHRYGEDFDFLARLAFTAQGIDVRFRIYALGLLVSRHATWFSSYIQSNWLQFTELMNVSDTLIEGMGRDRASTDLKYLFSGSFATENLKVLQIAVFLSMMQRDTANVKQKSMIRIISTVMLSGGILWGAENAYSNQKVGNRLVAELKNFQTLFMIMAHEFGHLILDYEHQFESGALGLPSKAGHELGADLFALTYAEKMGWNVKPYLEFADAENDFLFFRYHGVVPSRSGHREARVVIHQIYEFLSWFFQTQSYARDLAEVVGWRMRLGVFLGLIDSFKSGGLSFVDLGGNIFFRLFINSDFAHPVDPYAPTIPDIRPTGFSINPDSPFLRRRSEGRAGAPDMREIFLSMMASVELHLDPKKFTTTQITDLGYTSVSSTVITESVRRTKSGVRKAPRGSNIDRYYSDINETRYEVQAHPHPYDRSFQHGGSYSSFLLTEEQATRYAHNWRVGHNENVEKFLAKAVHGFKGYSKYRKGSVIKIWKKFFEILDQAERDMLIYILQFYRQTNWRDEGYGVWPTAEHVASHFSMSSFLDVITVFERIADKAHKFNEGEQLKVPINQLRPWSSDYANYKRAHDIKGGLSIVGLVELKVVLGGNVEGGAGSGESAEHRSEMRNQILKAQNPGLHAAVLRQEYEWNNQTWSRSEAHKTKARSEEFHETTSAIDSRSEAREASKPHMLILDDRLSHANFVKQVYQDRYAVTIALNIQDAMAQVENRKDAFDLIISDVDLLSRLEKRFLNFANWFLRSLANLFGFRYRTLDLIRVNSENFNPNTISLRKGGLYFVDWLIANKQIDANKIILHSTGFEKVGHNATASNFSRMQKLIGWLDPILAWGIKKKIPHYRELGVQVQPKSVIFDEARVRSAIQALRELEDGNDSLAIRDLLRRFRFHKQAGLLDRHSQQQVAEWVGGDVNFKIDPDVVRMVRDFIFYLMIDRHGSLLTKLAGLSEENWTKVLALTLRAAIGRKQLTDFGLWRGNSAVDLDDDLGNAIVAFIPAPDVENLNLDILEAAVGVVETMVRDIKEILEEENEEGFELLSSDAPQHGSVADPKNRSEMRNQINSPVVLTQQASLRLDVNEKAFDPLTGDSQLVFDRVNNRVMTIQGEPVDFGGKNSFGDSKLPLRELYDPGSAVMQLPTSNLGYNAYYAGFANGTVYRYSLDPRDYQYEMLVTDKDGQMRKQAVRLQDGNGKAGVFDAQSGRDLSSNIDFGFYGPQILKNGIFNHGAAAEFDDLRHVLRLPIFVFDSKKDGKYLGHEVIAGNQIHLGFSDGAGELFNNKELVINASRGEVIQLSLEPLLTANAEQNREALSVVEIQAAFSAWGYKKVLDQRDVLSLGDFFIDQANQTISVKFLPGVHPHTAVGLTKNGELVVAGVSGETHFEGATLQSLAQAMRDTGAEDVWVWANGKDTRLINDQGNDIVHVNNARQEALALISLLPMRSEMRKQIPEARASTVGGQAGLVARSVEMAPAHAEGDDEARFQAWLEAQMAADTANEVRLVQLTQQVSPEGKALWQQSLARWKDAIAAKEIPKTAPVIFYSPEIETQLIEFIELTQKSFELAYPGQGTRLHHFALVFRTDYERIAFEKKFGKLKQVKTYGPQTMGYLVTDVFNAPEWRDHYGVFGAREILTGMAWQRNLSAESLPTEISFALVPEAMAFFAATRTDEIEAAWATGFGSWNKHLQIRKGEGIFLLSSILELFSAAARRVMTSA